MALNLLHEAGFNRNDDCQEQQICHYAFQFLTPIVLDTSYCNATSGSMSSDDGRGLLPQRSFGLSDEGVQRFAQASRALAGAVLDRDCAPCGTARDRWVTLSTADGNVVKVFFASSKPDPALRPLLEFLDELHAEVTACSGSLLESCGEINPRTGDFIAACSSQPAWDTQCNECPAALRPLQGTPCDGICGQCSADVCTASCIRDCQGTPMHWAVQCVEVP